MRRICGTHCSTKTLNCKDESRKKRKFYAASEQNGNETEKPSHRLQTGMTRLGLQGVPARLHDPAQVELTQPLAGLGADRPQAGLVEGGIQTGVTEKVGEGLTAAFLVAKINSSVKYKLWKSR